MTWAVLEGAGKLQKTLTHLRGATQRRIMRPAINKALTPINREAKARAPDAWVHAEGRADWDNSPTLVLKPR